MDPRHRPFTIDQVAQFVRTGAVPGEERREIPAWWVKIGSDHARVRLSIQEEAADDGGIIRGVGCPHRIDTETGLPMFDSQSMRRAFLPVDVVDASPHEDSHFGRFASPDRILMATGCGNLLTNEGIAAALPLDRDGRRDRDTFGIAGLGRVRTTSALVSVDGRCGAAVDIGTADIIRGALPPFPTIDGFAISGPRLVRDGRPTTPDVREYADLRHLLRPAYVDIAPGLRVDFGFDRLDVDRTAAADAVAGRAVRLPLAYRFPNGVNGMGAEEILPVDPSVLRRALDAKGYRASATPSDPGEYRIERAEAIVVFLPGLYPHQALGVDGRGLLQTLVVGGASNRAGVTISVLSNALVELGLRDAWLMDNGGDVALRLYDGPTVARDLIPPCEADRAKRWKLRAAFLWTEGHVGDSINNRA